MTSRYRTRNISPGYHTGGSAKALAAGLNDQVQTDTHPFLRENCSDVVGNYGTTNPLSIFQDDWTLCWVTGKNSNFWECTNWMHYLDGGGSIPQLDGRNDDIVGTIALGRANPSVPTLDVWNFAWEIKDIPEMIQSTVKFMRKYGENPRLRWPKGKYSDVYRELGDAYLNWTFGWDLLLSDIRTMLDFVGAVEKRQQDLMALRAGELRKTVQISTTRGTSEILSYWGPLYQASSRLRVKATYEKKIWVRVRYKPTADTFKYLGTDLRDTAERLAFGITAPSLDTVWNAMPWSWLLDWFTTAGDYFSATRNNLALIVDDVAIMRSMSLVDFHVDFAENPHGATLRVNPHYQWNYKGRTRWSGMPVIAAFIPNLGTKQLSILAALGQKYNRV